MINRHNFVYLGLLMAFWPYVTFGFIAEEILPPLEPLRPIVYILTDIIALVLGLWLMRNKKDVAIIASYFVIAFFSTVILNHEGMAMFLNGSRDFVGLIFMMPIFRFLLEGPRRDEFMKKFDRQLLIYLWIQAFCVTEQFLRYGANDHGGGSWGNNYSGIVSTSIYFISFYLMTRRWDTALSYGANLWRNRLLLFLLFPTFLNETKVSFIYFMLYFLFLLEMNRGYLRKMAVACVVMILVMPVLGWAYLNATGQEGDEIFTMEAMDMYLFGGDEADEIIEMMQLAQENPNLEFDNGWVMDLPRFTKVFLLGDLLSHSRGGMWLGAGVGQFKGGSMVAASKFAIDNNWAMEGTRPFLFFILLQLGYVGLIWFIASMIADIAFKKRFGGPFSLNIKMFFMMVVVIMLFYNEAMRAMPLCLVMFYPLAQTVVAAPASRGRGDRDDTLSREYS